MPVPIPYNPPAICDTPAAPYEDNHKTEMDIDKCHTPCESEDLDIDTQTHYTSHNPLHYPDTPLLINILFVFFCHISRRLR